MASISKEGERWRVQFIDGDGKRRTIRLGRVSRREAELVCRHIEDLLASKIAGTPIPRVTATWLQTLGESLKEKLVRDGLLDAKTVTPILSVFIADYITSRRDLRPLTLRHLQEAGEQIIKYLGDRPLGEITAGDAEDLSAKLFAKYSPNTARRMLGRAKQYFNYAVRKGLLERNPFAELRGLNVRPNPERDCYIPVEDIQRLLAVLPNAEWRALVTIVHFGGLRCPSEIVELTWQDVNWEVGKIAIRSSKTWRSGKGWRLVPLFPEIREYLTELFEQTPEGEIYVFPRLRRCALGSSGLRNANLRTQFTRYILQAGLKPWPKLWSNLRRSCAIDLTMRFPFFAVTEWLGHTQAVAENFYLRVTPQIEEEARNYHRLKATQNPTQQMHEMERTEEKPLGKLNA